MADLLSLKEKTKNLSVLYVEDSPILQKKMTIFLGKLFKIVYQANNGVEGLQSFQHDKPDIIITDLDMPEMNGHEMIKKIKDIDENANIIIYSAYADSENLLESIHNGVVDFIPKPVDIELFEKVLTKVIAKSGLEQKRTTVETSNNTTQNNKQQEATNATDKDEIFKQLEIIKKSHQPIEFVNHYRGVPIYDKGTINIIGFDSITVEVPFLQMKAIQYEACSVLISELFDREIEATIRKINGFNNTIEMDNIQYLQDKSKKRKVVCVEPDSTNFSCFLSYQYIPINARIDLFSTEFVTLYIELEEDIELVEGNTLNLQVIIGELEDGRTSEKNLIFNLKGELYIMEKVSDEETKIMLLLEMERRERKILDNYVSMRRNELIVEFKQMKG